MYLSNIIKSIIYSLSTINLPLFRTWEDFIKLFLQVTMEFFPLFRIFAVAINYAAIFAFESFFTYMAGMVLIQISLLVIKLLELLLQVTYDNLKAIVIVIMLIYFWKIRPVIIRMTRTQEQDQDSVNSYQQLD